MQSDTHAHEYAELKRLLTQQGLFDRQPVYYTYKVLQMLSFLVLALALLSTTDLFWVQILNAAFLACVFTQIAFMGHDAGQMFCQAHSIPYCETSIIQAYRDILRYLHYVSAPLRRP